MKCLRSSLFTITLILLLFLNSFAQNDTSYYPNDYDISEQEWQKQMDDLTVRKVNAYAELHRLEIEKDSLLKVLKIADSLDKQAMNEIYVLLDINESEIKEFNNRFEATEKKILNESAPLSDIKEYWLDWISKSKIRLLKQYRNRYRIMMDKIDNRKDK